MGAPEREAGPPRRQFVTRSQVDDAAARGQILSVGARDVVTDEAAQRARDLGVRIERSPGPVPGTGGPARARGPRSTSARAGQTPAQESGALRHAVRAAVIAELGAAPRDLDRVIDGVLRDRGL
ncbi:MAG: hypothetical protein WCF36_18100 [Candidatus Nanopelagicales bacterium]